MYPISSLTVFCLDITTYNKAAVMKPLSAIASSSFDASSSPWSLVSLPSLKMTPKKEDGVKSGIQTSEAVLQTAVCPSI